MDKIKPTWDCCHIEILLEIFKYLDQRELMSCMAICRLWRDIAEYYAEKTGFWSNVFEKRMINAKENFVQKSTLDWRELFFNSCMWLEVDTAKVTLKHVYDLAYVSCIHVYKDNLIVVCADSVKYFSTEKCTLIKEILIKCLDYQETEDLIVSVTWNDISIEELHLHLSIYSKLHDQSHEIHGRHYRVQGNKCYVVGRKNIVYLVKSTSKDLEKCTLTRFYYSHLSLGAIHLYEDSVYLFFLNGCLLKWNLLQFEQQCHMNVPEIILDVGRTGTLMTMFHRHSVVYAADTEEVLTSKDVNGDVHLALLYPGLTCAVEHGDVLFLGFNDGKLGIVITKNIAVTRNMKPAFEFSISNLTNENNRECVRQMDVYEASGCHHLFIATNNNLYQVVLSLPDYKIVL